MSTCVSKGQKRLAVREANNRLSCRFNSGVCISLLGLHNASQSLGHLNSRSSSSHKSGGQKSKIQETTGSVSSEASSLGL